MQNHNPWYAVIEVENHSIPVQETKTPALLPLVLVMALRSLRSLRSRY
jgi:hypothetical protein